MRVKSGFETMFFEPIVQIGVGGFISSRDKALCGAGGQEPFNLWSVDIELAFARSTRSSQLHPLCLAETQRFGGALRDEIALKLRRHRERHGDNLALHTLIEMPVAFDRIDTDALLQGDGENLHTLQHAPPQPG